jgi:hypothetical protein
MQVNDYILSPLIKFYFSIIKEKAKESYLGRLHDNSNMTFENLEKMADQTLKALDTFLID